MTPINGPIYRLIGQPFGPPPTPTIPSTLDELEQLMADVKRINANGAVSKPDTIDAAAWSEPEDLGSELPPVPIFDERLLPNALRPWVEDVAERMQVPLDYPATCAIAALAGVCGRRAQIQPKAHDTGWNVVPNLWGAIIGPPGDLKTPTLTNMTAPARAIETGWRTTHEEAMRQYAEAQEIAELNNAVWKEDYKRKARTETDKSKLPTKPTENPTEPTQPRLITTDATPEALHKLLAANPAGIFLVRDELTGWLAGFERQGREQERSLWLECWNGNGLSFTMDRIERGSLHVPHCCASVFGGIQPDRLHAYMAEALKNGPSNDGLIQRFQLVTWPDPRTSYTYVDRVPNEQALNGAAQIYQRIAQLSVDNPLRLKFDRDAQALFECWLPELENRLRSDEMNPFLVAHLAKFRSLMPSLALLGSLADDPLAQAVGLTNSQRAADLCDYYEQHAKRMYASKISPERLAAISLSKKLRNGWKRGAAKFTIREVYFNDWSGLGTPEEVRAAVRVLEEAGWVRPQASKADTGRPSEIYAINPRIGGVHADR
jgi:putative DNA primase/helicase